MATTLSFESYQFIVMDLFSNNTNTPWSILKTPLKQKNAVKKISFFVVLLFLWTTYILVSKK